MYLVLLTGGLASGKGTVRSYLEDLGATILDLDEIAKQEQEAPAVLAQLTEAFGPDIVDTDGRLVRRVLAERAFSDEHATSVLNSICWPPVVKRVEDHLAEIQQDPSTADGLVVVEVPLLVESGALLDRADQVISIAAADELRLERAVTRGMDRTDALRRLEQQATDAQRAEISDVIIVNQGSLEALFEQVQAWYDEGRDQERF